MAVITKSPYLRGPDILANPDCLLSEIKLDYSSTPDGCIKAGTPLNANGAPSNNSAAIGILRHDAYEGIHERGLFVVSGFVREAVIAVHAGITLTDEARAAMHKIAFVDNQGCITPASGGGSGGGSGGVIILSVVAGEYDASLGDNVKTYTINTSFAELSQQLSDQTAPPVLVSEHYSGEATTWSAHLILNDSADPPYVMISYPSHEPSTFLALFSDDTIEPALAG